MNLRDLDRRAVAGTVQLVETITPDQLRLPTPCPDWTVYGLLRHMISQHLGFAAAARGEVPDLAVWDSGRLGDDPAAAYRAASDEVLSAFADDAALDRTVEMTELRRTLPGRVALAFHFIDYLVHGWDLASALGVSRELDPELVDAALTFFSRAGTAPTTSPIRVPFEPRFDVAEDATPTERLLARVGRKADWK